MAELRTLGPEVITALGTGLEASDGDDGTLQKSGEAIGVEVGTVFSHATLAEFWTGANPSLTVGTDVAQYMMTVKPIVFATPTIAIRIDCERIADGDDHDSDTLMGTIAVSAACAITWSNVIHPGLVRRRGAIVCTNTAGGSIAVTIGSGAVVVTLAAGVTNPGIGTAVGATLEIEYTIMSITSIRIDSCTGAAAGVLITNPGTISATPLGKIGTSHAVTGFAYAGTGTVTYQWKRSGAAIPGATSATYTPDASDDGTDLTRTTTVTGASGSSSATTPPQAITYPVPVITNPGTIAAAANLGKVGAPHTVSGFAYTGTGTLTYVWKRGGVAISGATSAGYTPVSADALTTLTRETTVTNSGGPDVDTTAGQLITYEFEPQWVDNNGTAYIYYDGTAFGSDTAYFDMFVLFKRMTGNPPTICRIHQNRSAKHDVRWDSSGKLRVTMKDAAGTPVTLLDWISTSAVDVAGEWLFHIALDFTGTPTCNFSKIERINGVMQSWAAIPGTFTIGPVAGIVDHAGGGANYEFTVLQSYTIDTNMADCDYAFSWYSYATPVADTAMADNGVLKNPLSVGSPIVLSRGPAVNLTNDEGSANLTFVATGFTDTV